MDLVVFTAFVALVGLAITVWIAGALFFDVAQGAWWGWVLVVAWVAAVTVLFWWTDQRSHPLLTLSVILAVFLWWWLKLEPTHDRQWDPNFAQLSSVAIEHDELVVHNVRNTEYRSSTDYSTRYETRRYRLSQMEGLDVLILYWGSRFMCHPMFVFNFGGGGRLCISIEVRYRVGQRYNFWKSLYRQQELTYIVSDERDAILRRTKCLAGHDMYLYRVFGDPLEMRQFFFEYANRINRLVATPQWYNGVTSNCTTGIYSQGRGRIEWDWRMLFNGTIDRMFYERQRLDQSLPFEELKRLSWVNEIANQAPAEGFSEYLRGELPGYRIGTP